LVLAACGSKEPPNTQSPECLSILWGYDESQQSDPSKTTVTLSVIRKAGEYTVNELSFTFGDGQEATIDHPPLDNLSTEHVYPTPGEFTATASFTAEGFQDTFQCPPEQISIAARQ